MKFMVIVKKVIVFVGATLFVWAVLQTVKLAYYAGTIAVPIVGRTMADEQPKLTVGQALSLLAALRNLDGHVIVVKQNGIDATVLVPWEFGSGTLRLRVAQDIAILAKAEQAAEASRQAIVRELLRQLPANKDGSQPAIAQGTVQWTEFQRQYGEVLEQPAAGVDGLLRIKASDLKLDRNDVPVTALAALEPILDDDVSPRK